MNLYQKLATARVQLQNKGLQKTGNNRNFKYFELKDFLPTANEIFAELKMCGVVTYDNDFATLTIFDGEKDEKIVFTSPVVQKALPTGTEIQNLGAIQTYQRRYLYLTALEIAENDAVDCLDTGNEPQKQKSQTNSKPLTQTTNSTLPKQPPVEKSTIEKLKDGLRKCKSKKELEERYGKQMPWLQQNYRELIDEYNSFYDECLFNLTV